jgi:hypothetical protein
MKLIDTLRRLGLIVAAGAALAAAGLAVTGCKGASPTPVDCAGRTAAITYGGLAATTSPAIADVVSDATVGTAVTVPAPTLVLADITSPASCVAHPAFSTTGLPPGLSLDAATGAITGTPTQSGLYVIQVAVVPSDAVGTAFTAGRIAFEIQSPTLRAFSSWTDPRGVPDLLGTLAAQGGRLAFLQPGATTLDIQVSSDGGLTWVAQAPASAPPSRTGFTTVTDDAGRLYVSGGTDAGNTALADLWMYDGSTWTQLAATTPFPGASPMLASSGHLYAVNGGAWRSDDGGVTWIAVADHVWGASEPAALVAKCGADLGGTPVVVGQLDSVVSGTPATVRAWTSPDLGATWVEQSLPATGPFSALGGVSQCMSAGGRLFLVGGGQYTDSRHDVIATSDFGAWEYQPRRAQWISLQVSQGTAVIGSSLYSVFNGNLYFSQP